MSELHYVLYSTHLGAHSALEKVRGILLETNCEVFGGMWGFSTCNNEPTDEDLCAGHVSGGECDGLLVG